MSERKSEDRRKPAGKLSLPFRDSNGERVLEDRRKQFDRRMNGIDEAEWSVMHETAKKIANAGNHK